MSALAVAAAVLFLAVLASALLDPRRFNTERAHEEAPSVYEIMLPYLS